MVARRGDNCDLERGVWQCVSVLSEWGPLHIKRGRGEKTACTRRVWDIFKATGKTFLLTPILKKKKTKKKKAPTLIHINTHAKSVGMLRKCQTCLLSFFSSRLLFPSIFYVPPVAGVLPMFLRSAWSGTESLAISSQPVRLLSAGRSRGVTRSRRGEHSSPLWREHTVRTHRQSTHANGAEGNRCDETGPKLLILSSSLTSWENRGGEGKH